MSETSAPPGPPSPRSLLMQPGGWRLERRLYTSPLREFTAVVIAVAASVLAGGLLVAVAGAGVVEAFRAMYEGAFGTMEAALETLVQATPLIMTGLAAAVAFRAAIWNIGGEGQLYAGMAGAWWVSDLLGGLRPAPLLFLLMFLGAALAGAFWASIASVLKAVYKTNEILTTVMLNFVMFFVLSWLLAGPWRSPTTYYYQTERMADHTFLPRFAEDSRLHWGFAVAVLTAALVYFVLRKTPLGYEIRGLGANPVASRYKGTNVAAVIIAVMAISGAVAGLGGAGELLGLHHRLQLDIAVGAGFTGIIIALVARLHPLGVVVTAVAFGALVNGSTAVQVETGIPAALVQVIEGVTLILVLLAAVAARYRIARPSPAHG